MAFTLAQEAGPKIQGHSMFMSLEPFPSLPLSFMPLKSIRQLFFVECLLIWVV